MDKYYVSGVKTDAEGDCEICADNEAHFFTLYERNAAGESQSIDDLDSRTGAETIMAVYVERDNLQAEVTRLQQQVNALAAENVAITEQFSLYPEAVKHWNSWADPEDRIPDAQPTPATDAAIREIEARAWADALCMVKSAIACDSVDNIEFLFKGKVDQLRAGEVSNG